jgi:hypothetical protein
MTAITLEEVAVVLAAPVQRRRVTQSLLVEVLVELSLVLLTALVVVVLTRVVEQMPQQILAEAGPAPTLAAALVLL